MNTKRRRHRRLFCDYSALRFTVYFGSPKVHTAQHIGPNTDTPLSTRSHHPPTPHMQHETHHTPHIHITCTWVDTNRRRHQRLFREYSAHMFRRVFRVANRPHITTHSPTPTHHCQHGPTTHPHHTCKIETHHTPHTSQVLGWTPGDEGTNDYFATIRPIGFAVYFATHATQDTPHTTHTHITGTWVDTRRRRHQRLCRDDSAHRFRRVFHHTQHKTHHTPHTHHRYLGGHQATKAPTTILRLFCLTFRRVFRVANRPHITTHSPTPTHHCQHGPTTHPHHTCKIETHHTPHTSQVFGWTPGDEGTNYYFATIRPIGFAVYFTTHTTQDTPHTTHTHHRYLGGHQATKAPTTISRLFGP